MIYVPKKMRGLNNNNNNNKTSSQIFELYFYTFYEHSGHVRQSLPISALAERYTVMSSTFNFKGLFSSLINFELLLQVKRILSKCYYICKVRIYGRWEKTKLFRPKLYAILQFGST